MSSRVFLNNYGQITSSSEPMALGSPPTSPGYILPHGATQNQSYLPGFLMGDSPQIQTATVNAHAHGSSRSIQLSPTNTSILGNGKTKHTEVAFAKTPSMEPRLSKRHTSPPTQSIWAMGQPGSVTRSTAPVSTECQSGRLTLRHSTPNAVGRGSIVNSNILSPLGSSNKISSGDWISRQPLAELPVSPGNELLSTERLAEVLAVNQRKSPDTAVDESWITVFGYPLARATFLLGQFAQFGTIEKHVITNDGNWMHIKYQNKLQARCALSRNGRVFGENIMVGVAPCTDRSVMLESVHRKSNQKMLRPVQVSSVTNVSSPPIRQLCGSAGFRQPLNSCNRPDPLMNQSFTASPCPPRERVSSLARHSSMRSLAGRTPGGQFTRAASIRQEPGLLSKALGYMFGWP